MYSSSKLPCWMQNFSSIMGCETCSLGTVTPFSILFLSSICPFYSDFYVKTIGSPHLFVNVTHTIHWDKRNIRTLLPAADDPVETFSFEILDLETE